MCNILDGLRLPTPAKKNNRKFTMLSDGRFVDMATGKHVCVTLPDGNIVDNFLQLPESPYKELIKKYFIKQ